MIALACTLGTSTGCDSLANLFNLFDPENGQTDTDVPIISTVAGTGLAGQNGDGLAPADTALYLPQDITMGPDGNLYIVDWNNHRIRRIKDGVVETVAGTGELGPADDGTAIDQQFNHPTNVCFDHEGRMVIAAWHNSKVKRCNLETGLVENLAGTGARSFGGDDGPGNAAILDLPSSVDVDAVGNIIISDQANYRIRLLEPNGTIHTIVGDGTAGYAGDGDRAEKARLNSPKGQSAPPAGRIELDANDRIIIADTGNHVIRLVDNDGTIRTIAGTGIPGYSGDEGPATAAQLNTPSDVAVGPDGSIYVADTQNNCIRVIHPDGEIHTFAGTGEAGYDGDGGDAKLAKLDRPYGVHIASNGDIYIADTHNHRVRKVVLGQPTGGPPDVMQDDIEIIPCTDAPGSICTFAGTGQLGYNGDDLDRLQTALYWPFDIEFTPSGRTYLIDWNNHKVRELRADGTIHTVIGTDFVGDGPADLADLTIPGTSGLRVDLNHPTDMFELPNGLLGVIAWHNHKIRMYDPATGLVFVAMGRNAAFAGDGGAAKDARVNQPARSVLDANGNLLLIDQRNQRIRLFEDYVNKIGDATIRSILGTGTAGATGDGLKPLETQVKWPTGGNPEPTGGIAIDANGVVYFADTNNHRIRKAVFNADYTDGVVTTICGTGTAGDSGDNGPGTAAQINYPQDIELGPDGKLYFCDTNNNRVRRIDLATGMVEAVAGTGEKGYSGDGGAAATATLNRPFGIAFDKDGYLYICDTFNGRIRKVRL